VAPALTRAAHPPDLPAFAFVGGKGGVGKTTCAAMLALRASDRGRTLLVTTDPASSLASVLGASVGAEPRRLRGAARAFAASVDAAGAFARWLAPRKALLSAIALRGTYLDEEDVARLLKLSLPGIDEVIGLLEILRLVREADAPFDRVVVDTAPTGHTLRLLASPALLGRVARVLDALQSHHRTVVSALRGAYRSDAADALIVELDRDGEALAALLRDRGRTEVTWVTLPEPMALEETADAIGALGESGIHVMRLIVNRVMPPSHGDGAGDRGCAWCEARRRFEARALAPVARRFRDLELLALPELADEPRGVGPLRAAARALGPWHVPVHAPPVVTRQRATLDRHASGELRDLTDVTGGARWLLFGGKGGVGKSTCAAAAALQLAESKRVLLISTDPAHSLGDVFGAPVGNEPGPVPGAPASLRVREIDAAAEMDRFRRRYVAAVDDAFAKIARTAAGDQAAFRDLIDLAPPGIDEVIAVADVAEAIAGGTDGYDVIVTDTAPTGHALRLLQTPALLRDWTLALMAILLKYREIVGAGTLAALLVQLSKRLRALQDILADQAQSRFIVVARAAKVPVDESLQLIAALRPMGIAVGAVIVNAAGAGDCATCRGARRAQSAAIAALRRGVRGAYAIIEAPAELPPPHGAAALRAWRRSWRRLT
jgi:arsenite-transporting ATPase